MLAKAGGKDQKIEHINYTSKIAEVFSCKGKSLILFFLLLFPFLHTAQTDSIHKKSDLSFDFGITRGRNINAWPLFKKYKNEERKELDILFPLYAKRENYKLHTKHFRFVPFYFSDSSAKVTDYRILSTYYPSLIHIRKETLSDSSREKETSVKIMELAPYISLFGYSRSPGGVKVENNIFFFFLYRKDEILKREKLVVFPAYWHFSNQTDTTNLFLPFYYQRKKANSRRLNVLFLYNRHVTPNSRSNVFFPLVWNKSVFRPTDTLRKNVVFPVYWSRTDKNSDNKTVFPLFYKFENRNRKSTTIFPLYWNRQTFTRMDTITREVLFPLIWTYRSDDTRRTVFFPFVFKKENNLQTSLTVFPLFSYRNSFDSSRSRLMLTPFFWRIKERDELRHILFPVYWSKREYLAGDTAIRRVLFPVYWSRKYKDVKNTSIFPLVFSLKNSRYKSFTFFPLISFGRSSDSSSKHLALTPLFWRLEKPNSKRSVFFPLYFSKTSWTKHDTLHQEIAFPFIWTFKSRTYNNKVFFPLVYSFSNEDYKSLTVFPFFSAGASSDSSSRHLVLTPLFWKISNPSGVKKVVFPLYWNSRRYFLDDTVEKEVLFPLYWSHKSSKERKRFFFPLFYHFDGTYRQSFTFIPFYSKGMDKDSSRSHLMVTPLYWSLKSKSRDLDFLFPLYWHQKKYGRDSSQWSLLFPLYFRYQSNTSDNKIFTPFIYDLKNRYYQSLTFFPFFSKGQATDSSFSHLAITPLFWKIKNDYTKTNILFPVYWKHENYYLNDTVRHEVLFPLIWTKRSKNETNTTFFPIVFSRKNNERVSMTVFPFFSYGHKLDSSRKYFSVTPFFWHVERQNKSKANVLFPVYWSLRKYGRFDTTHREILFPIIWTKKTRDINNKVFFPLVFSLKNTKRRSITFIPLFSWGENKYRARKHLAITPLFWHFKNRDGKTNVLFPLYWNKTEYFRGDTIRKTVLFPLYWSGVSRNTSARLLFPLFAYMKDADNSSRLMVTPLFWRKQSDRGKRTLLIPLYFSETVFAMDDTIHKKLILPFYYSSHSNKKKVDVLFPLVWKIKDSVKSSFAFLPLFSYGKNNVSGRKYMLLTPFFGTYTSEKQSGSFLFPIYNYRRTGEEQHFSALLFLLRRTKGPQYSRTSFLWPLCEQVKDSNSTKFRIAPLVWFSKTDTSRMLSVQPLFYSFRSEKRKLFILSAFLYKREVVENVSTSNSFLWRAYYSKKYSNGDFEKRFLHLVAANIKVDGKRERSILPFYHKIEEKNGDKSVSVFFGFYNHFRQYKTEIKDYYEEERIFWFVRLRSNYKQLKAEGKTGFSRHRKK